MLSSQRIKEAEQNVRSYLAEGLLTKTKDFNKDSLNVLIRNKDESIKAAGVLLKTNTSNLWVIVCSYYAMYYMAKAVLYEQQYKVGEKISHKVTADSVIAYLRSKIKDIILEEYEESKEDALEIACIKADEIAESFDLERAKRSRFQYSMDETVVNSKAVTSLERAKRFIFEMRKLMA